MFAQQFVNRLRVKVQQKEDALLLEMSRGTAKDFAEYKLYVGRLRGLGEIHGLISETAKELELEADE